MPKALVLGTSFTAIPIINRLQRRGFSVTTVGRLPNDEGHRISDAQIIEDYSDWRSVMESVKGQTFDAVVPTCNDVSYLSAAYLSQNLGVFFPDKPETVLSLHTKEKFKEVLNRLNIPTASRMTEDNITFPAFIKPSDAFSGRGCSIVRFKDQLEDSIEFAKKNSVSGSYIIENFIEGTLHSISTFICPEGATCDHFLVDEFVSESGFSVVSSIYPSILPPDITSEIIRAQKKIINDQKLTRGLLHSQFLMSKGKMFFVETMRRAPGDMFGEQVILGASIDYWNKYIDGFVEGLDPTARTEIQKIYPVSRNIIGSFEEISIFQGFQLSSNGPISAIDIVFYPLKVSGDRLNALPGSKAGVMFVKYENGTTPIVPTVGLL
jgi:hypothetical protein